MPSITSISSNATSPTTGHATWTYSADTAFINVQLTGPGTQSITNLSAIDGTGSCDFTGCNPSSSYVVHVVPQDANHVSYTEVTSSFTTPPSSTTNVSTSNVANDRFNYHAQSNYYGASVFDVYLNGVIKAQLVDGSDNGNGYYYLDGVFVALTASTNYTVHIDVYSQGVVVESGSASVTTLADPVPPGDVTGLVATPFYPPPYVHLSWNPASGATSYEIHYGKTAGFYDKVVNTGNTNTTADITDVFKGQQFYFDVYGVNSAGRSANVSNIVYAVAGPGRPNDFGWTYTTVSAGSPVGMDSRDWNNLTAKINEFRNYYPNATLSPYSFTTASPGIFEAFYYRQAVSAISDMSPPLPLPPLHYTNDDVLATDIDRLRLSLNSIA
jgi:hypothetical protein